MEDVAQLAANGIDAGSSESFKSPDAKRLLEDKAGWRLVFQLGPDGTIGNMLPGAINILLHEDDLAAGRFERAWAVYDKD
jgi:uncharacterized protein YwqG